MDAVSTTAKLAGKTMWQGQKKITFGWDPASFTMPVTDDEYHGNTEYVSSTQLKSILKSPQHFLATVQGAGKDTHALEFGRLTHMAVLEPWRFEDLVLPFDGEFNRRFRECKRFIAEHPNQIVIGQDRHDAIQSMRNAVRAHRFRGRPLGDWFDEAEAEKAFYFVERVTGVKCRIKVDAAHPKFIFDLKSTPDVLPRPFNSSVQSYSYDLSAFMYQTGIQYFTGEERPFIFVAVEKEAPYSVMVYTAGDSLLDNGAQKFEDALNRLKHARKHDSWPGYAGEYVLEVDRWHEYRSNHLILGD
jgi:hypothetical protein